MKDKLRILIVEDEAIIAENLKLSLEDLGYVVVDTCYNSTTAVEALTTGDCDLVLLDINLNDRQDKQAGFTLAKKIKEQLKKPFIFLTAYNDKDTINTASKLQPFGYLIKPVNDAMLFAAIQTAIERFNNNTTIDRPDNQDEKPDYFYVRLGSTTHKIYWTEIFCIEAGKNYVKLRSRISNIDYPIRGSLSYVIEQLLPTNLVKDFIRVNRSIYLNQSYITKFDKEFVYCQNDRFENSKNLIKQLKNTIAAGADDI